MRKSSPFAASVIIWERKMIKKAQISFVLITISILLFVFGIIFCGSQFFIDMAKQQSIDRSIDRIAYIYLQNEDNRVNSSPIPSKSIYYYKNYSPVYDSNTFTKEQVFYYVNYWVTLDPPFEGKIGNLVYKTYSEEYLSYDSSSAYCIVALDVSDTITMFHQFSIKLLSILVVILVLLSCLVCALSFIVVKPIKDTFSKQKMFISDASHELKTPLTIISASTDVIRKDPVNAQWINNIKSQTQRLEGLVNDMLTLAKFDEAKFTVCPTRVNLSEVVTDCVLPFEALAYEKGKQLSLSVEKDVFANCDLNCVKKVITILTDNAVKYAEERSVIYVSLVKEGDKAVFTTKNDGSIIHEKDSNRIFERFYRGDASRSRESGGSGLGLSIAKSFADANKWKLYAKSVYGKTMTITLIVK